jgi:DNA mismatch repair protein MutL
MEPLRQTLASLRVVGQVQQTYIVAEGAGGMYLIDQHAAHERVVFDRLCRQMADRDRNSQPLLVPSPAELTFSQHATLLEYYDLLADCGFDLEPFGDNAWLVRAVPPQLTTNHADPARALVELLDAVAVEQVVMDRDKALAATIACHGSVRAGQTLSTEEMAALLTQLEATPDPHNCPHGRPTVVHFTQYQLEREFGRR